MCNSKTSSSYCIGGILISHSFLPFQVLLAMLTVIFEAGCLATTTQFVILDFLNIRHCFSVLESFHLKAQMNLKTWLAETDNVIAVK